MSTQYWHGGKLPGRVELPDGWVAYTEPGAPWGWFLAVDPSGNLHLCELPRSGEMRNTHQVMDDDDEPTGFYVWVVATDTLGTVRIAREYWD